MQQQQRLNQKFESDSQKFTGMRIENRGNGKQCVRTCPLLTPRFLAFRLTSSTNFLGEFVIITRTFFSTQELFSTEFHGPAENYHA